MGGPHKTLETSSIVPSGLILAAPISSRLHPTIPVTFVVEPFDDKTGVAIIRRPRVHSARSVFPMTQCRQCRGFAFFEFTGERPFVVNMIIEW